MQFQLYSGVAVCFFLELSAKKTPTYRSVVLPSWRTFSSLLIILVFLFPLHRSLDLDESPTQATPPTLPLLETKADEGTAASDASGGSQAAAKTSLEEVRLQQGPKEVNRTEVELQEFHQHHGRLLPNCKNAVHVIDGPERRYFVGIIDIFTVYNWRKKLEHLWKSVRYPGRDFSTVSPTKYSSRFCQWIQERSHWAGLTTLNFSLSWK